MKRKLTTTQQIDKFNRAMRLATEAAKSSDVVRRLGAFVLNAGTADSLAIQAARLVEQIILKGQLAEGKTPTFQPHEDAYFYDARISTRNILNEIKRLLPFKSPDLSCSAEAEEISKLALAFIQAGEAFLNYRIPVVHHLGNPKKSLEDIFTLCDKANEAFDQLIETHHVFFEAAAPYRFSQVEFDRFYAKS